jgi:hypothetical protein
MIEREWIDIGPKTSQGVAGILVPIDPSALDRPVGDGVLGALDRENSTWPNALISRGPCDGWRRGFPRTSSV